MSSLISISRDCTIREWDIATGSSLHTISCPGGCSFPLTISLSRDGHFIAFSTDNRIINVVNLEDKSTVVSITMVDSAISLCFNDTGTHLAVGYQNAGLAIWNLEESRVVSVPHPRVLYNVFSVHYSYSGKFIATGSSDSAVRIFDGLSGESICSLNGHRTFVSAVRFSPDDTKIASASGDWSVCIWDFTSQSQVCKLLGHRSGATSISFANDGIKLASGSLDCSIIIWNIVSGSKLYVLKKLGWVHSVCFSPDDRYIAGSGDPQDCHIHVWDACTGTKIAELEGHEGCVDCIAFSPTIVKDYLLK